MVELIKQYSKKVKREGVFKSILFGFSFGFMITSIISIVSFITTQNLIIVSILVGLLMSLVGTVVLYKFMYKPNIKDVVKRIDSLGLEERMLTMLDYSDKESFILDRQREDAKIHLNTVNPIDIKMKLIKIPIIFLALTFFIATNLVVFSGINAVSNNLDNLVDTENELSEEDKIIAELLENLREIIDNANISDSLKADLHTMVDALEIDLVNYTTTLEKIARIKETQEIIMELINNALEEQEFEMSTAEALIAQGERTDDLGYAIESKDLEMLADAFDEMYERLSQLYGEKLAEELMANGEDILEALDNSINDDEEVRAALKELAEAFIEAALKLMENNEGDEEFPSDLEEALDKAEEALGEAMEQNDMEEAQSNMDQAFEDALEQLGDIMNGESEEEGEEPEEEEQEGEEPEGNDSSSSGSDESNAGENVLDGETHYSEVYPYSYEEALALIQSGILTEEQARLIAEYYNIIDTSTEE